MALKSVLSPEKITGKSNKGVLSARKFISGGSSLGGSVFGNAANKIVNFQRSGVQPSPVDVGSIIKTISAGVVNNYNNQAQSINNSVTNIISKSVSNLSKDYQDRIKKVDEAKPTGVLQKILGLYKDVIGFIQFFGKRKFVEDLRDNLKALQKSFTDSFEVAKLIRQAIIKIVKQLSNLPKASPSGGGGINLDVDIPGGGLKKSAPRGLGRMMRRVGGKGRMLALGAGALGLGAAGGAAVNALSGSDAIQPGGAAPEIPGNIVDSLSSIIDRFARAIDSLVKGGSGKTSGSSSGSSSGSAAKPAEKGAPGDTSGAPGAPDNNIQASPGGAKTAEELALIQTVMQREGADYTTVYGGKKVPQLTEITLGELHQASKLGGTDRLPSRLGGGVIPYAKDQHNSSATGAPQLMPDTLKTLLNSGKFKENQKFTKEAQNEIILELARRRGVDPTKKLTERDISKLGPEWASFTPALGQSKNTASSTLNVYLKNLERIKKEGFVSQAAPTAQAQAQAAPTAQVAPQVQTQVEQRVSTVSQPAQQKPQVNYLPIDMSGGGEKQAQQSPGGGDISAPPPTPQSGPSVPFLSATNTDNFLVLYSRMVYNIVDG